MTINEWHACYYVYYTLCTNNANIYYGMTVHVHYISILYSIKEH
jgi:hypothetical protein